MDKTNTETKFYYFTIKISDKAICHAAGYEKFIKKQIESGNKIPARVVKKFLSFFSLYDREEIETNLRNEILNKRLKTILDSLDKKHYYFKGTRELKKNEDAISFIQINQKITGNKIEYSLKTMLGYILEFIMSNENSGNKKWTKDEYIGNAYLELCNYRNLIMNKRHQKFLNEYKLHVLSAHITLVTYGRKITTAENPTNEVLFHSVRNAINKIKSPE